METQTTKTPTIAFFKPCSGGNNIYMQCTCTCILCTTKYTLLTTVLFSLDLNEAPPTYTALILSRRLGVGQVHCVRATCGMRLEVVCLYELNSCYRCNSEYPIIY